MSTDIISFESIEPDDLRDTLESIDVAYDLVAVTLTNGDIILGCIFKHWRWNGQTVDINFNYLTGQIYGASEVVTVPIELIADISVIPLDDAIVPRLDPDDPEIEMIKEMFGEFDTRISVADWPNPLASIIYQHNAELISSHHFIVNDYLEFSLPEDAIPIGGIIFDKDFLLYVDWAFFSQQVTGSVSISAGIPGVANISKDIRHSLEVQVLQRLKDSLANKIREGISSAIGEHTLYGSILIPEPTNTTIIEGEECHLFIVAENLDGGAACPVLLKVKSLKYPFEFLRYISSALTFYGELLPIPLNVLGETHQKVLLARAIGYLNS